MNKPILTALLSLALLPLLLARSRADTGPWTAWQPLGASGVSWRCRKEVNPGDDLALWSVQYRNDNACKIDLHYGFDTDPGKLNIDQMTFLEPGAIWTPADYFPAEEPMLYTIVQAERDRD